MATASEVVEYIKEVVAKEVNVTGSRLTPLIKEKYPEWRIEDTGRRNLKEFISANIPEIGIVGRAGFDIIYGIGGDTGKLLLDTRTPAQTDVWKVWVSPNSPYALEVSRETGVVTAPAKKEATQEPNSRLQVPTADEHLRIALEFADTQPDPIRKRLSTILGEHRDHWWKLWPREISRLSLQNSWGAFRRQELESHFIKQIKSLMISDEAAAKALESLQKSRTDAKKVSSARTISEATGPDSESELRRLVLKAVKRMSISELRDLKIPVGLMIDVFSEARPE